MTDKQIIIDGVDVRKCVNRRWDNSQKIHLCYDSDTPLTSWGWCENNPNCYYKQLKAKEQECEELKAKCKKYGEINEQETKHYAYLKAENEELKKTLTDGGLHNLNLMTEKRVLLQTLTEIKEIVFPKNQLIITDSPIILKIQEKISECEENDGN